MSNYKVELRSDNKNTSDENITRNGRKKKKKTSDKHITKNRRKKIKILEISTLLLIGFFF